MATFKAIVINKTESGTAAALTDFDEAGLMEGDVTLRPEWSTVNYKDGLAVTGKAPVVRRFPMIAGVDAAAVVEASSRPAWKPGDKVLVNGWGCGETHLGMYAEKARVKGDWLVALPPGLTGRDAMAIGTAGYTAMLCVMAPLALRNQAWQRLATELDRHKLAKMTEEIDLGGVVAAGNKIIEGGVRGRLVVKIR